MHIFDCQDGDLPSSNRALSQEEKKQLKIAYDIVWKLVGVLCLIPIGYIFWPKKVFAAADFSSVEKKLVDLDLNKKIILQEQNLLMEETKRLNEELKSIDLKFIKFQADKLLFESNLSKYFQKHFKKANEKIQQKVEFELASKIRIKKRLQTLQTLNPLKWVEEIVNLNYDAFLIAERAKKELLKKESKSGFLRRSTFLRRRERGKQEVIDILKKEFFEIEKTQDCIKNTISSLPRKMKISTVLVPIKDCLSFPEKNAVDQTKFATLFAQKVFEILIE